MSLTSHRPFKLRLPEMASSLNSSDDWTWALQATYQCGKVQEFVFGEEAANAVQYAQLLREIESWKINRPIGFDPVFYEAGGIAGSFPAIYLHMDYHGEFISKGEWGHPTDGSSHGLAIHCHGTLAVGCSPAIAQSWTVPPTSTERYGKRRQR